MCRLKPCLFPALAVVFLVGCRSKKDEVEVAAFKGGYGIDFYEKAGKEFGAKNPGPPVRVWGNPRVWDQLGPRFVAGDPPDLALPGWDMRVWSLIYDHELEPWDGALDGPAPEGGGTWRSTFLPATLKLGEYDGKVYLMPFYYSVEGWWYNVDLFEKNSWKPPKTWSELIALCDKIKAAGIAPITYQGVYPSYAIAGFLFPWAISAGGMQAVDDAQNLVPGAWRSPAMLQAAQRIDELRMKGDFEDKAIGMTHTMSQLEFIEGRAAMIPCGTWLHSEMAQQLPQGFRMRFFLPPRLDVDKGDPTNVCFSVEPWIVPAKAKHKSAAIAFFRYMTSLGKAREFVMSKGTLMAVKGSDQLSLPEELVDAAKASRQARTSWSIMYGQWYPKFGKDTEGAMSALLSGRATPQEFCDRCEAAAAVERNDKATPKHKVTH